MINFQGILGKKYGPSRVLPIMMLVFGTMTVLAGKIANLKNPKVEVLTHLLVTAQNWAGIMALRWFLGKYYTDLRAPQR